MTLARPNSDLGLSQVWPLIPTAEERSLNLPQCGFESHRGYVVPESRGGVHISVIIPGCDPGQTGSIPVPRPASLNGGAARNERLIY
jgi:hypothetical protein